MADNGFTSKLSEENAPLNETKNETFFSDLKDEASKWATHFYDKNIEKKTSDMMKDSAIDFYWFLYGKAKSFGLPAVAVLFLIGSPIIPILLSAFVIFQACQSSINPIFSYFSNKFGIPSKATKETKALFKKKAILDLTKKRTDKLIDKKINDLNKQHANATKLLSRLKQDYPDRKKLIQEYNTKINNFREQIKNAKEFKLKTFNENSKLIDEHSDKLAEKPYNEQRWMSSKTKKIEKHFDKLNGVESSYTQTSISNNQSDTQATFPNMENKNYLLSNKKEAPTINSNIFDKNHKPTSLSEAFKNSMQQPLNAEQKLIKSDKLEQSKTTLLKQPNSLSLPSKPANGIRI